MPAIFQNRYRLAERAAEALPAVLQPAPAAEPLPFVSQRRLDVSAYARLTGYRAGVADAKSAFAEAILASGGDAVLALTVSGGKSAVYLGAPGGTLDALTRGIAAELPMAEWTPAAAGEARCPLFDEYPFGGYVGGLSSCALETDALLRSLGAEDCLIGMAIHPCPREALSDERRRAQRLLELVEPFCTRTVFHGGSNARPVRHTNRRLTLASEAIAALSERLSDAVNGRAAQVALWYAAKTPEHAGHVGALLLETLRRTEDGPLSRAPYLQPTRETTLSYDGFYLPHARSAALPEGCELPLFQNPLVALVTGDGIPGLLPIPADSHPGFHVLLPVRDETSFHEFDIQPHAADGPSLALGRITETGEEERLPLSAIGEHVLLCGASGSGKGFTIRRMLVGLSRLRIPFVLFEPIKFEFADLPDYGVNVKIYSSGITGRRLCFNPFIPEPMTVLYSHIKGLVGALTAASDNLAPIPQALEMVICEAYRRHGWVTGERVLPSDTRSFPTFPEVVELIRPFFRESTLYQGDVKTNVASALYTRMSALAGFAFLRGEEKLPTADILGDNTSIQFDGLDQQADKCFLANALLLNLNEALRQEPLNGGLRRVFVLDEAHNFFLKTNSENTSSASVSQFFGNLLSEIRANGCGIVVSDQRPDILNPCVLENTKVKIIHASDGGDDISAVSDQLKLSDHQLRLYHALTPGQAIVCVRGMRQVVRIQVEKPGQDPSGRNRVTMCGFCGFGHICCRREVAPYLEGFPVRHSCQRLSGNMADPDALAAQTAAILAEAGLQNAPPNLRQCFFGHVVEGMDNPLYRQFFDSFYANRKERST